LFDGKCCLLAAAAGLRQKVLTQSSDCEKNGYSRRPTYKVLEDSSLQRFSFSSS
jgi:hypothetical protein